MKLKWDEIGTRKYETGVDRGVLYPQKDGTYPKGVSWSGLTAVTESPSGAEDNPFYADNMKYLSIKSAEEFGLTIECYTTPDEWEECNGEGRVAAGVTIAQQKRNTFGLAYRTIVGNDTEGQEKGYKIHLVWGCSASPSERSYTTVNDSPDIITFSYEITTVSVPVTGFKPTSQMTIDSTEIEPDKLKAIEDIIYGTDSNEARLPMPDEVIALLADDIAE